jgi:adenine-specific DNA-methyltransferase
MKRQIVNTELLEKNLETELKDWKTYGAVSTPEEIVKLMVDLAGIKASKPMDVLEPACGFCNFLTEIYKRDNKSKFTGVDLNPEVYKALKRVYANLPLELVLADYLLWNSDKKFDLVIGNPPYGIIGNENHYAIGVVKGKKQEYKRTFQTWSGKYNIYGAFIEKSVKLLKKNGKLVFIVPATWMILDDFKKLRSFLLDSGLVRIYYLGGKVFKSVTVSVCILVFENGGKGLELFERGSNGKMMPILKLNHWGKNMISFEDKDSEKFRSNKVLLNDLFDIRISARSPELNKFPYLLKNNVKNSLPVLNGRNVQKGYIKRENFTGQWIADKKVSEFKNFYSILPHIVVGHTKGGKVISALETELFPYTGDVYHLLPKVKLEEKDMIRIVEWLNSDNMEVYLRRLYKDISPHITSTQLKDLPIDIKIDTGKLF